MMFGVSGNFGASSLAIHRNPVTIAAIKRQKEKERLRKLESDPTHRSKIEHMERIKAQIAADRAAKEERFRREFLYDITKLRMVHMNIVEQARAKSSPTNRTGAVDIIHYHAGKSGFTYEEIIGPSRHRPLLKVRFKAIADVYVLCPHLSLSQIGQIFGGRDHTSILNAVMRVGAHQSQTGVERQHGNYIPLREALAA